MYETAEMPNDKAIKFIQEFDKRVGTDREINYIGDFNSYIFAFELTSKEVNICKEIENSLQ